jgi:hypothetical protein
MTRSRGVKYEDALRLLGARDSKLVGVLDRLRSVASVGASVATAGVADLFDIGDELVAWTRDLSRFLDERAVGASRYDRTQLIEAAHGVLVVAAFHEALAEAAGDRASGLLALRSGGDVPRSVRELWTRSKMELVVRMLGTELPIPSPNQPYTMTAMVIELAYNTWLLPADLMFKAEPAEDHVNRRVDWLDEVQDAALRRYEASFRRLAVAVPEFAFWATAIESQATHRLLTSLESKVDSLTTGLEGVATLLDGVGGRSSIVDQRRAELALLYRGRIERPVLELQGVSDRLELPSLAAAYVNPPCRVAVKRRGDGSWDLADDAWEDQPAATDVQRYLAGHLTSGEATRAPLVVYGQPGSGKSSLAKILAARLPETDFCALVVPLREVPADAIVSEQVAVGLRRETNDTVTWAELSQSLDGALPVIVLDGLDEMLQASSVERAGYLEEVLAFQRDEADRGRPVAVIVTSRTAVAQRVRVPGEASLLRLEPFDTEHITRWVETWNALTGASRPLSVERVLDYAEIAGQPLLLLLIALYDRRTDGLRQLETTTQAGLFEAVLRDYTLREIRRVSDTRTPDEEERAIELDLRRLGVAALSMVNRSTLLLTDHELQGDLDALAEAVADDAGDGRTAYDVVGSFYFVHTSRAREGVDTGSKSFEFLHSTVGEFLAARLIVRSLCDLAEDRTYHARRPTSREPDAGLFWAATSFEAISDSPQVADFCQQLLDGLADDVCSGLSATLRDQLATSLHDHPTWSFRDYAPVEAVTVRRQAAYSANLVLLHVILNADGTTADDLCGSRTTFHSYANLWTSQLSRSALYSMLGRVRPTFLVEWSNRDEHRDSVDRLWIFPERGQSVGLYTSLPLTWTSLPRSDFRDPQLFPEIEVRAESDAGRLLRDTTFFGRSHLTARLLHAVAAYWHHVEEEAPGPDVVDDGWTYGSSMGLMLELVFAPPAPRSDVFARYLRAVSTFREAASLAVVFRQLRLDAEALGDERLTDLLFHAASLERISPTQLALVIATMSDTEALHKGLVEDRGRSEYLDSLIEVVEAVQGG